MPQAEYFGRKFTKEKFDSIDGNTYIQFREESSNVVDPFSIRVSKQGMNFKGYLDVPISSEKELQDFARLISDMWQEHRKLAPKIHTTLSGH